MRSSSQPSGRRKRFLSTYKHFSINISFFHSGLWFIEHVFKVSMDATPSEGNLSLNRSFNLLFTFPWIRRPQFWRTRSYRNWAGQKHRRRGDVPVIPHLLGIQKGETLKLLLIALKGGRRCVGNKTPSEANGRKDFYWFQRFAPGLWWKGSLPSIPVGGSREDTPAKALEQERTWKGKVLREQSGSKPAGRELQGQGLFKDEGLHTFHNLE